MERMDFEAYNGPLRGQTIPGALFQDGRYEYRVIHPVLPSCHLHTWGIEHENCVLAHEFSKLCQLWTYRVLQHPESGKILAVAVKGEWL